MVHHNDASPLLYSELASWFHLLTAPDDYRKEAEFYAQVLKETAHLPVKEVLEMGSGGGNNASHMKSRYKLTLTDLSEDMLLVSRGLNPECEHIQGDMRNLRLGREFDAVFAQDAVSYMATEDDLSATVKTAFIHCRPGGVVLLCPDYVKETFGEYTQHGGHTVGERGLRYLEWAYDPDPDDTSYIVDFAIILRENDNVRFCNDIHIMGLFTTDIWLALLKQTGFVDVRTVKWPDRKDNYYATPLFTGIKPE